MAKQYFNFIIIHKLLKSNEYISKTNEKDDNKKCKLFILNEKFLLYAFWEAGRAEAIMNYSILNVYFEVYLLTKVEVPLATEARPNRKPYCGIFYSMRWELNIMLLFRNHPGYYN